MFRLRRPSRRVIERFLEGQHTRGFSYSELGATDQSAPTGYTVDHNRIRLGDGAEVFSIARRRLSDWRMFQLEWVHLFQENTPIEVGATVAVLVRHFGFWSLNAARIVYLIEQPRRYGFAYGTLQDHAEQGEERFSVEWSSDDSVWYDILAFSKPRHWSARLGRPLSRKLQKQFAQDSMKAMKSGFAEYNIFLEGD